MGLIKCPDCNKMFSDRIDACPECGCPTIEALKENDKRKQNDNKEEVKIEKTKAKDKNENMFEINKEDLMSSKELKEFALNNILPILKKEIDIKDIKKGDSNKDDVDLYIITSSEKIGIDLFVEVAPSQRSYIYNENHAKLMSLKGYKYAIAQIGIGACDPIKFERRRVFKNDEYYFNYEKLKYFDYEKISNTRIMYSLSADNYEYIYKREDDNSNPYAIVKEVPNFKKDYISENYNLLFINIAKLYNIPEQDIKFYAKYNLSLAEAINYSIDVRTLLYTFLYCVDYCKGIFLSDSKTILKRNIIPECYTLLEDNKLIKLSKYDKYVFAYYVYYFLTNNETQCSLETVTYMNKLKISLFEKQPKYFGINQINEDDKEKVNSYHNIYRMIQEGSNFITNEYEKYIQINFEINSAGIKNPIDFENLKNRIEKLLIDSKNKLKYLQEGFNILNDFPKKETYTKYRKALSSFVKLLELDYSMMKKLTEKSKGGKYGFFEYKKDSKIRNTQCEESIKLIDEIKDIFELKNISKSTHILIDACHYLIKNLKVKYFEEIIDDKTKYKEFKNELCSFYDDVLTMQYDKEIEDFRNGVLMTITDFIELIELKENEDKNYDKIDNYEDDLKENIKIINEKIYELQI